MNKLNNVHEKCLGLITNDHKSTFKKPPESSYELSIQKTCITLREKCPYSELFWSVFSRIRTEYLEILSVFSPNAGKCGPE